MMVFLWFRSWSIPVESSLLNQWLTSVSLAVTFGLQTGTQIILIGWEQTRSNGSSSTSNAIVFILFRLFNMYIDQFNWSKWYYDLFYILCIWGNWLTNIIFMACSSFAPCWLHFHNQLSHISHKRKHDLMYQGNHDNYDLKVDQAKKVAYHYLCKLNVKIHTPALQH